MVSFYSKIVYKKCACGYRIPLLPFQHTDRKLCVQTVGAGKRVHSVRQFLGIGGTQNLHFAYIR